MCKPIGEGSHLVDSAHHLLMFCKYSFMPSSNIYIHALLPSILFIYGVDHNIYIHPFLIQEKRQMLIDMLKQKLVVADISRYMIFQGPFIQHTKVVNRKKMPWINRAVFSRFKSFLTLFKISCMLPHKILLAGQLPKIEKIYMHN